MASGCFHATDRSRLGYFAQLRQPRAGRGACRTRRVSPSAAKPRELVGSLPDGGTGVVGSLSRPDRPASVGGIASARLHGRLYHSPSLDSGGAASRRGDARVAVRDGSRRPGPDGLWHLRDRLLGRTPSPRLPVQLPARLLASPIPAVRREPGHADDAARTRACLRVPGRRGGHLPLRQHEGSGHRLRRRRAALQHTFPGLCHALWFSTVGLQATQASDQGQGRTAVSLRRNQPAQWPHLSHVGTSQRGHAGVVGERRGRACLAGAEEVAPRIVPG